MVSKNVGLLSMVAGLVVPAAFGQEKSDKMVNITSKVRVDAYQEKSKVGSMDETSNFEGWKLKNAEVKLEGMVSGGAVGYTLYLKPLAIASLATGTQAGADGATDVIAEATINHKISKMISARIGRMPVNVGSVEYDYSSYDMYFGSYHGSVLNMTQLTSTGAELSFLPLGTDEHAIKLQVTDGMDSKTKTGGNASAKGGMNTVLSYYGNISGGMIKPIINYGQYRYSTPKQYDATAPNDNNQVNSGNPAATGLGVGAQFNVADLAIDAEYEMVNYAKVKSGDTEVKKAETYSGAILQVKYNVKAVNLAPWIKVTSETHKMKNKFDESADLNYMLTAIGAEWAATQNLRYHVAYGQGVKTNNKAGDGTNGADAGANLKTTTTTVLVGAGVKI